MKELTRLFDLSPEDIHCEVRFGNVRDEIIRMSKEGEYDVIVIGSKPDYHHASAGFKCGIYPALRHYSGPVVR